MGSNHKNVPYTAESSDFVPWIFSDFVLGTDPERSLFPLGRPCIVGKPPSYLFLPIVLYDGILHSLVPKWNKGAQHCPHTLMPKHVPRT